VAVLLAGILAAKAVVPRRTDDAPSDQVSSITALHNDAVADYQEALKAGKPIYVLFHSLS
jgi:hypothetical protein